MKYILIPIGRLLYVIFALIMLPVIYAIAGLQVLWDWDTKAFKEVTDAYTNNFHPQDDDYVKEGQQYYVYKTPLDYLKRNKTWRTKEKRN
jgi:hypothetical protein